MGWFDKMETIAEGFSDFGDFKAVLFRASDGRHFVRILPFDNSEKPLIDWLSGNDHLEWLRRWST
jgi:antibiotic biosynthesis monooxygenase (ABM) superfamily enzyme